MLIRLLGRPEMIMEDGRLDLGTPRQQVALAVLLLADGMTAPVDALVDRIWDEAPPNRCRNIVATYLSRLRRILNREPGEPVRIGYRHGTYTLSCSAEAVDLYRFRTGLRLARAAAARGEHAVALDLYGDALGQWHGPALAGLPGRWTSTAAAQVERERRDAHAARVNLLLGLGEVEGATTELQPLVHDNPLDEQFALQLMSALHWSGRDAQALEVYHALSRRLRDQLGVEPSTSVQSLHLRLLKAQPAAAVRLANPPAIDPARRWPHRNRERFPGA